MTPVKKGALIMVLALAAGWGGLEFGRWTRSQSAPQTGTSNANAVQQLLVTSFKTPEGDAKTLNAWQGKILVINFWATWCPPCREEMPEFSQAQDEYGPNGVQFVGIAVDQASNVVDFTKKTPVSYPLLVANPDITGLMAQLGNPQQGLPFTIILGRDGKPLSAHLGRLSKEDLSKQLKPLL